VTHDVIFEKEVEGVWRPTMSSDLKPGDKTRLKCSDGTILDEGTVTAKNSQDPDSKQSFDISIGG
jgi:hypothetical protein